MTKFFITSDYKLTNGTMSLIIAGSVIAGILLTYSF